MARLLIDRGFKRVRPLAGGFDAWIEAGYGAEGLLEIEVREGTLPARPSAS